MKKNKRRKKIRPAGYRAGKHGGGLLLKIYFFLFIAAVLALAVFIGRFVFIYMAEMPEIPLERVKMQGAPGLDYAGLLESAGVGRRANLMELEPKKLKLGLIEAEPYIKDAVVDKNLHSGLLSIKIKLRTPVFLISHNGLWWVDREGVVIGDIGRLGHRDLPVITGLDVPVPPPGAAITSGRLDNAFAILRSAGDSGIEEGMVSEINVSDSRSIILFLGDSGESMQVRFNVNDFQDRMDEAAALIASFMEEGREVEYIDLRFPGRPPVVRFRR